MATVLVTTALAGTAAYVGSRGPSTSYVDGYNFAANMMHGLGAPPATEITRRNANSSCSVWSFPNAGAVPAGDRPLEWRQGCEVALTSGAGHTIPR